MMVGNKKIQEVKITRYKNGNVRVLQNDIEARASRIVKKTDYLGLLRVGGVIAIGAIIGLIAGQTYGSQLPDYFGFMTFAAAVFLTLAFEIKDGKITDTIYRRIKMGNKTVIIYNNKNTNNLIALVISLMFFVIGITGGILLYVFWPIIMSDLHTLLNLFIIN